MPIHTAARHVLWSQDYQSVPDFLHFRTFQQLLDLDESDEDDWSRGIIKEYFNQVRESLSLIEKRMYMIMFV